ncbi:hypothetical protein RDI58_027171 [Solanum bulbocastanum]|uniref:Large ribosomal subunit protein uL15/eL18 domain-containing protein n=1 Tax=Solanum bulbocastanum TaxID=147425 RepID=A0AAN8Y1K1_SOLBU
MDASPMSDDVYLKLFVKHYRFLVRMPESKLNLEGMTVVIVGKITNDVRAYEISKLKGSTWIEHASPQRGQRMHVNHFNLALGVPHNHTKLYVRSTRRKFERDKGKRKSKGYKA